MVIGGNTPEETAQNYARILKKLHNANLKIAPEKTKIFPESADMLGWIWDEAEGGSFNTGPNVMFKDYLMQMLSLLRAELRIYVL